MGLILWTRVLETSPVGLLGAGGSHFTERETGPEVTGPGGPAQVVRAVGQGPEAHRLCRGGSELSSSAATPTREGPFPQLAPRPVTPALGGLCGSTAVSANAAWDEWQQDGPVPQACSHRLEERPGGPSPGPLLLVRKPPSPRGPRGAPATLSFWPQARCHGDLPAGARGILCVFSEPLQPQPAPLS